MLKFISFIGVVFQLLEFQICGASADTVPALDVRQSCNAAARGSVIEGRDTEACMNDERAAQDQTKQNWSKYSTSDKTQCVGMVRQGGPPSYVELLSCLEMMTDARKIKIGEIADPLQDTTSSTVSTRKKRPKHQ
jgi:hypothetical protein